jgi:hypothetical protein
MASSINKSTTGIASDAPISVYAGSKENADLLASQKKVFPGNVVGAVYAASTELGSDEIDFEEDLVGDDFATTETSSNEAAATILGSISPYISDISVISNEVVYDAAGNPSVTVVLKVKNSSGQTLKGINARVQAL